LLARWERFARLREEVSRALEGARREKTIGTPLEAHVVLETGDDDRAFLESFGDDLRFLLIVSRVSFDLAGDNAVAAESVPGMRVGILRADGRKCGRCWHYTEDVGDDDEFEELCARCAGNVRTILGAGDSA
jgi:isoleucyl-tRNA synthetase